MHRQLRLRLCSLLSLSFPTWIPRDLDGTFPQHSGLGKLWLRVPTLVPKPSDLGQAVWDSLPPSPSPKIGVMRTPTH